MDFVKPRRRKKEVERPHLYIAGALGFGTSRWSDQGDDGAVTTAEEEVLAACARGDGGAAIGICVPRRGRDECFVSFPSATAAAEVKALLARERPDWEVRYTATQMELEQEERQRIEEEIAAAGRVYTPEEVRPSALIPGLLVLDGIVCEEEERELIEACDRSEEESHWVTLKKRRVKHFGHIFDYLKREVDWSEDSAPHMPACFRRLLERVARDAIPGDRGDEAEWRGVRGAVAVMDQLTVNEYTPKVGLSPHCDSHRSFGDTIIIVSLAGHTIFELRNRDADRVVLLLPRRSLLVMHGEARYGWEHYIPHRKDDWVNGELIQRPPRRVSLTFRERRKRGNPCQCTFRHYCDDCQ